MGKKTKKRWIEGYDRGREGATHIKLGWGGLFTTYVGPLFSSASAIFFIYCTRAIVYRVLRLSHSLGVCALFLSPSRSKGWGSCIDPGDFKGWRRAHRTRSKACV